MKNIDEFHKSLLENLHDGIYFTDLKRKILFWNKSAERITGFNSGEILGRCCADNILSHVDDKGNMLCLSDCPLTESMTQGKPVEKELFLHHKNGHRVPVLVRVSPVRDDKGEIVGAVEAFSDNSSKMEALERVEELQKIAFVDALTGVGTRRFGEDMLRSRLDESRRYGWTFGILSVDLDNLKQINDLHGHEAGDHALVLVARTLVANVRSFDFVARWGGDEFLVIVTNLNAENILSLADKLRSLVGVSLLPPPTEMRVTVSIGATVCHSGDTVRSLLKRADRLLYEGKALGRNRVSTDLVTA
ncbi:MAG: diguanylate cyclase [Acidobacteria bacterium]|nr:MAG: diguanylate cyclase [Acidobacteriota bacterium]